MKIKDYTDTIRHLTDPFNIPEARRMIQENPALTQEQFKVGGLVEPGVTHYGTEDELGSFIHKQKGKHALKSYYNFSITDRSKGKYKVLAHKLVEATPENLKKLKELRDKKVKELFPNRISDEKFTQLRLKNKNLNNEDFAKLLNKKKYKTHQNVSWEDQSIQVKQEKLNLRGKVGVSARSPRPEEEVIAGLKKYEGGDKVVADYLKTNRSPDDLNSLRSKLNQREHYRRLVSTEEGKKLSLERALKYRRLNPEAIKALNMRRWTQEGMFPTGSTYPEHLWRDLYRSSKSKGGKRFKFLSEMPPLKTTKAGNQVRDWLGNDYYKKVKFKDLETGKIINYKNLEKYLDTTMGKGTYKKALSGYELKDTLKNQEITYKGKKSTLGGLLKQNLYSAEQISKQPLLSPLEVHHPAGVGKNWWSNEVVFRDANQTLRDLDSSLTANLKRAEGFTAKKALLQNYAKKVEKLPGGITSVLRATPYGVPTTAKSVLHAAGKEAGLLKSKNFRAKVNSAKAQTLAKALELKGIKICQKGIVEKESGGRIGFAGKCGVALAADNPNLYMKLAKESKGAEALFKSGQIGKYLKSAKTWAGSNLGPAGLIGGEFLAIGLGGAYEMTQGKGWKEALGSWTLLGGLGEKYSKERLEKIGKEQGWSEQQVYDAMKFQKLLALSQEGEEKEAKLEDFLERQDIGGTARFKSADVPSVTQNITGAIFGEGEDPSYPDYSGTRNIGERGYIRDKYQDPKFLRDLKEEVPEIWKEGGDLYKTLMNPQTSAALLQELQDRKKYEELKKKEKIWKALQRRPGIGQQVEAPEPSDLGPFERSPGHPGYTGAFTKWQPYAEGGIASLKKK